MHVSRLRRAEGPFPRKSMAERFWEKVDKTDTCWVWTGAKDKGYGRFGVAAGNVVGAHRVAYELLVGPIPQGMEIDHRCHNPACVNPSHLRPATHKQNLEHRNSKPNRVAAAGYRGVLRRGRSYRAQVDQYGKRHYFGSYPTAEEAAEAARLGRIKLFTHNDVDRLPSQQDEDLPGKQKHGAEERRSQ